MHLFDVNAAMSAASAYVLIYGSVDASINLRKSTCFSLNGWLASIIGSQTGLVSKFCGYIDATASMTTNRFGVDLAYARVHAYCEYLPATDEYLLNPSCRSTPVVSRQLLYATRLYAYQDRGHCPTLKKLFRVE